jgi:hypothetical protein
MIRVTAQTVYRALLPASMLVFILGLAISCITFFRERPVDFKSAVLSDLESRDENPHGYGALAAAFAISAILLVPAVISFTRRLRRESPVLTLAGTVMFSLGLGSAIAIAVLAPFTSGYSPMHIVLAYGVFMGFCGGTAFHLAAARARVVLIALQCGVFLLLASLWIGQVSFTNDRLLTSLAFLEWILCADCAFALWALASAVARNYGDA